MMNEERARPRMCIDCAATAAAAAVSAAVSAARSTIGGVRQAE